MNVLHAGPLIRKKMTSAPQSNEGEDLRHLEIYIFQWLPSWYPLLLGSLLNVLPRVFL